MKKEMKNTKNANKNTIKQKDETEHNASESKKHDNDNTHKIQELQENIEESNYEANSLAILLEIREKGHGNPDSEVYDTITNEAAEIPGEEEEVNPINEFEMVENVNQAQEELQNTESGEIQVLKPYARKLRKERTVKRHTGKEYVTAKGKLIKKRIMKELPNCRMKCREWLKPDLRDNIFSDYWQQGDHSKRTNYIAKLVTTSPIRTRRVRNENSAKTRDVTYNYVFEIDGQRRKVCKGCFTATLSETDKFIRNTLRNKGSSLCGIVKDDLRGKHRPWNITSHEQRQEVIAHIESFPRYESHYTRRVNDKKYLPSDLNLSKMYKLYCELNTKPVGRKIYEYEFHKLKLAFKIPKTDTCHKCEVMNMQLQVASDVDEQNQIKLDQEKHHQEADLAYQSKKIDKNHAKVDDSFVCYTFDLQQCLPTPYLETSVSFYKRKYWTYNLTMHNCGTGFASCYMWHETLGMRGANEIASCIFKEIMDLSPDVKNITLYSDTCGGQNKNFPVIAMFLTIMQLKPTIHEINHKFMISGHSHMECDVDHSLIEKQKKRSGMKISHPQDWATLIRCTNKTKPFKVVELCQQDFYNFADLLKNGLVKRQKNSKGDPFKLHDCKWLKYTKQHGTVYYRHSLDENEEFKEINLSRRGRPGNFYLTKRYDRPLPIAAEKKEHLLELLSLVPEVFRTFYENHQTKVIADIDPDLEEYESDQE